MGKPFDLELKALHSTYQWSLNLSTEQLTTFIEKSCSLPLISIGSGGSQTAALMATLLHERAGAISKNYTPMNFVYSGMSLRNTSVFFFSAGGSNLDILSAFRHAVLSEPKELMVLTMKPGSPLSKLSNKYHWSHSIDFNPPFEKDGFLATNSLLTFIVLLIRSYSNLLPFPIILPDTLPNLKNFDHELDVLLLKKTWIILYGGWGLPVAINLESKCTEAALKNIQLSDYRNFGHGRHHWIAKRSEETGVIALITPEEENIANKTLNFIPSNIPSLRLSTNELGPTGSLDLFVKMFSLIAVLGRKEGIDPGNPRVPEFGRKIYNIRYLSNPLKVPGINKQMAAAIIRKIKAPSFHDIQSAELEFWMNAFNNYTSNLKRVKYNGIILDYDGTLCDTAKRFTGPCQEIICELLRILTFGVIVGVATGRGQSVRNDLKRLIPREYWNKVLIGYYNASDIAFLGDDRHPKKDEEFHSTLSTLREYLDRDDFKKIATYELRPSQITIIPNKLYLWKRTIDYVNELVYHYKDIQVFQSSHTLNIIPMDVSKLCLVNECLKICNQGDTSSSVLCIGDRGEWPGNDFELLSTPYSLSVDTVSNSIHVPVGIL